MRKETHLSSRYHSASFEKMCCNVSTHSDQTIKGVQIPISHSLWENGPVSSSFTGSWGSNRPPASISEAQLPEV
jgi:hypothetical protein